MTDPSDPRPNESASEYLARRTRERARDEQDSSDEQALTRGKPLIPASEERDGERGWRPIRDRRKNR